MVPVERIELPTFGNYWARTQHGLFSTAYHRGGLAHAVGRTGLGLKRIRVITLGTM
jgi:hypothetical protein